MMLPLLHPGRAVTSLCMALLLTANMSARADVGDTFTVDCCTYTVQTEANCTGTVSLTAFKATAEVPETLRIDRVTAPRHQHPVHRDGHQGTHLGLRQSLAKLCIYR